MTKAPPHHDEAPYANICTKCGYMWNQRSVQPPRKCPYCQTRNWAKQIVLSLDEKQPEQQHPTQAQLEELNDRTTTTDSPKT